MKLDSSTNIVISYEPDDRCLNPGMVHQVWIGSRAHPVSFIVSVRVLPWGKAAIPLHDVVINPLGNFAIHENSRALLEASGTEPSSCNSFLLTCSRNLIQKIFVIGNDRMRRYSDVSYYNIL